MTNSHPRCQVKEDITRAQTYSTDKMIAEAMGEPLKIKSHVRYILDGTEYLALSAGFAWPEGKQPGFVVVMGVIDSDPYEYKAIAEVESMKVPVLLKKAWGFWQRYGKNCSVVPYRMYGNYYDPRDKAIDEFRLTDKLILNNFYLTLPPQWDETDRDKAYLQTMDNIHERVTLTPILKSRLQSVDPESKLSPKQIFLASPATMALGYVLSAMEDYHPWLYDSTALPSDEEPVDEIDEAFV